MKKKMIPFLLTAAMLTQASPVFAAGDITAFTDYNQNLGYGQLSTHWAKNSITTLMGHNGINGYPEGDFRANKEISAAELIAILLNVSDNADDLTGETWAEKIMNRAYELGICTDTEIPLAEANKPISREKMALVLVNSASVFFDEDTTRAILVSAESIADLDTADAAYRDKIVQAYTLGLLAGTGINYQPKASTTRAEATAIVNRLMGYTDRVDVEKAEAERLAEKARQEEAARQAEIAKQKEAERLAAEKAAQEKAKKEADKVVSGEYEQEHYPTPDPINPDDGILTMEELEDGQQGGALWIPTENQGAYNSDWAQPDMSGSN